MKMCGQHKYWDLGGFCNVFVAYARDLAGSVNLRKSHECQEEKPTPGA